MENNARFRMNIGVLKSIVIAIVALGALAIIALDIALLSGAGKLHKASPALGGVSLAAAVVILVIAMLLLFNCNYTFKRDYMLVVLGIFWDKVKYSDIVMIKQNGSSDDIYLIIKSDGMETAAKVNIPHAVNDAFICALRQRVPDIEVETFFTDKK